MTTAPRIDWKIPLALLAISVIPIAAGVARIAGLSSPTEAADNARFIASPLVIVLHIVGASLFSVLGALQFSAGLRQRHLQWHKLAGRVAVPSGMVAAFTGLWMTVVYPIPPALQGELLFGVRVVVGIAMLISIVLSVAAVMQRDIAAHRAWMVRAYALGQGAGMQVVVLLPWMLVIGTPSVWQRDVLMSAAWLLNLSIAEWVIHQQTPKNFYFYKVNS